MLRVNSAAPPGRLGLLERHRGGSLGVRMESPREGGTLGLGRPGAFKRTMKPNANFDALVLRVAGGQSVRAAAKALRVPERTCRSWAARPEFKASVREAREAVMKQAVGVLGRLALKATKRLGKLVDSSDEKVALAASVALIDRLLDVRADAEVVDRLDALEGRNRVKTPPNTWPAQTA